MMGKDFCARARPARLPLASKAPTLPGGGRLGGHPGSLELAVRGRRKSRQDGGATPQLVKCATDNATCQSRP